MATYSKLPSGNWRVQIRRKGRYISETFLKRDDTRRWATETESRIDRGQSPLPAKAARLRTFKEIIDVHVADMKEVGKAPGRTKAATLEMLSLRLGKKKIPELDQELFVTFGRGRAAEGAGPVTLSMDLGVIRWSSNTPTPCMGCRSRPSRWT